ncbi:MAG: lysophospholipid acyltransferase family protein [Acidobacteriota bacterium]
MIDSLSVGGATRVARGLADLWWLADFPRRKVAVGNILGSGIETEPSRARALSRRSAHHFATVVIESLKSSEALDEERWREHIRLDIADDVMAVLEDPEQGLIMASGHFGSWEIAAQWLSRFKPVAGITRPMNNPRVEALIQQRKPRYRFNPIPKYAADPRRFIKVLKSGEILALLTDQHARSHGMEVEFFGRAAATYTTAAMLHLVTRTPLCFAACRRIGPMRFELVTSPLIDQKPSGDKKKDVKSILTTLNEHLEAMIRQDPDQYLWGHRRWR